MPAKMFFNSQKFSIRKKGVPMKKIAFVSLSAVAALSLVACSSEETTRTVDDSGVETAADNTMTAADSEAPAPNADVPAGTAASATQDSVAAAIREGERTADETAAEMKQ